jgi:hypothetical protein
MSIESSADMIYLAAERAAASENVHALVVVIDRTGAFQFRGGKADLNVIVGVLTRIGVQMSMLAQANPPAAAAASESTEQPS